MLTYLLLRALFFPFSLMPYRWIHKIGNLLGTTGYYLVPKYRKRSLSNLACAKDLNLSNEQIKKIAIGSVQNLVITMLEYSKLAREKDISNIAICENPEKANEILNEGKGVIFFVGHQANWEILFLEGTSRMEGVAIGKPSKNAYLYNYILKIREKFGGTMLTPKNALKEGLRALRKGKFLGIVGDQGMPDSGYSSLFLGRQAFSSPMPALLSYKTKTPIIVASVQRKENKYHIHYSDPIIPDPESTMETEVKRLMDETLSLFEQSVKKCPEQWFWGHNRWKQKFRGKHWKKSYNQDAIAIFLPEDEDLVKQVSIFREFYPTEFIAVYVPKSLENHCKIEAEVLLYEKPSDYLKEDLRFKLLYNLTKDKNIDKHYQKLAVSKTISLKETDLKKSLEALFSPKKTV